MTARLFAMKPTCLLLFVLFVCIWRNAWAAEPVLPLSSGEVKRLIVAVALLDYPVEQAPVREALGITDSVKPAWGGGLERETLLRVHEWKHLYQQVRLREKDAGSHGASAGTVVAAGTVIRNFGSSRPPATSTRLPRPSDILD